MLSLSPVWHLPPALGALKARGMRRLVAFSSTSVTAKAASPDAYEGRRMTARSLAEGEARVRAFCAAEGVAWTLLRPTLIYAEGQDQNVSRLASLIRRFGVLPLAGKGEGLRQPVHADDLAQGGLIAAAEPGRRGPRLRPAGRRDPDLPRHGRAGVRGHGPAAARSWPFRPACGALAFALARPLPDGAPTPRWARG